MQGSNVPVHFWPHTTRMHVASYRLRCYLVMEGLKKIGMPVALYEEGSRPTALVLSKRYDPQSVAKALELKARFGTRLFLDLCDNHFYYQESSRDAARRATELDHAIRSVDHLIASTEYLADVVRKRVGVSPQITVVEDLVEFPSHPGIVKMLSHPQHYLGYLRLQAFHRRHRLPKACRLVWFGNHGGGFADSGMNDLKNIHRLLEEVHAEVPISLTVISNSREKYEALVAGWSLPTHYMEWNEHFISPALCSHGVSVVPISQNPFTLAKSPNRVETSLVHGLQVVADEIPSYEKYAANIYLGDWLPGLRALVRGTGIKAPVSSQDFIGKNVSIIARWREALAS